MALSIKTPEDAATINTLLQLLIKERPIDQGARKEKMYCLTQDGEGNLRIPMALSRMLWSLPLPDLNTLRRKNISCDIVLGENGRTDQIATYNSMLECLLKTASVFGSLPCGFGKTMLAIKLFAVLGLKSAVLTDAKTIFPQWGNVLRERTDAVVVEITSGRNKKTKEIISKLPEGDIYVMMVKAARVMHPSTLKGIDLLIVDEATYFMTPERIPAMLNFTPTYCIGLCAEIERDDGMHCFLPYLFGNTVIRKISDRKFTVYRVETPYQPLVRFQRWKGNVDWNTILESLATNEQRNEDIIYLCRSLPESKIIIGCKRITQAKYLHEKLTQLGEVVGLLIENNNIIPQCRILIGIYAKMGKGVDVKNLCPEWVGEVFGVAILAADNCKPEQFIGRIFRSTSLPVVYDFVDDYSTLRKHFEKERLPWYTSRKGVVIKTIINRPSDSPLMKIAE